MGQLHNLIKKDTPLLEDKFQECKSLLNSNIIWCKKREWYIRECPFQNKNECNIFTEMCGLI